MMSNILEYSGEEHPLINFKTVNLETDLIEIDAQHDMEGTLPPPPPLRLRDLQNAVSYLPTFVNIALSGGELAQFSGEPVAEVCYFNDPWDMVTEALNTLFDVDAHVYDVVGLIW